MNTIGDMGEFGLIERVSRLVPSTEHVVEGIGDDCAVIRLGDQLLLASCDLFVEDVHFRRDTISPENLGWKALTASVSDIAAMGGRPLCALISLACPSETDSDYLEGIAKGISSAASHCGIAVVGGDTTRAPERIVMDVTVLGETTGHNYRLRRDAQPGDCLVCTGSLGMSAAGLHALEHGHENEELIRAHTRPEARIHEGRWLAQRSAVHAMIDVSDGLVQDAGHIANESGLGVNIDSERLFPAKALQAYCDAHDLSAKDFMLTGGEAYELAFAVDKAKCDALVTEFAASFSVDIHVLGMFTEMWTGLRVDVVEPTDMGFEHFKK